MRNALWAEAAELVREGAKDVRPLLPLGVDPALKRVPGMDIDFVEYQEMVQAFFEATVRVNPRTCTEEEAAALDRMAEKLLPYQETYGAWAKEQGERFLRRTRRRLALQVVAMVLVFLASCAFLLYRLAQEPGP